MFIGFANFYWYFIQGFSRIAAPLISMLKTTGLFEKSALRAFKAGNNKVVGGDNRANETIVDSSKSKNKKSRKSTCVPNIRAKRKLNFLTSNAKKAFNHLRLAFIKAPILWHFDLESYIRIEIDVSSYAISRVLSELNLDSDVSPNDSNKSDFSQWHLVAYFFRKMIPTETQHKTHNAELLAIVEAFKTWRHYLEGCKHKVLVITNYNNFCWFIDTKNLSSCQVRWA